MKCPSRWKPTNNSSDLIELDQIEQFHQRQQSPERRQPLRTFPIRRLRGQNRLPGFFRLPFCLLPLFTTLISAIFTHNHLGDLLSIGSFC